MNQSIYTGKGFISTSAISKALTARGYSLTDIKKWQDFFQDEQNLTITENIENVSANKGTRFGVINVKSRQDFDITIEALALSDLGRAVMYGLEKETVTNIPKFVTETGTISAAGEVTLAGGDLYTFDGGLNVVHSVTWADEPFIGRSLTQVADLTQPAGLDVNEYAIDAIGSNILNFNTIYEGRDVEVKYYAEDSSVTYRYAENFEYAPVWLSIMASISKVDSVTGDLLYPDTWEFPKCVPDGTWTMTQTNFDIARESFTFHCNGNPKKHITPINSD